MKMNDYTIRLEKAEEERDVENLVRESFWNVYRPGCLEHYVLHCLRKDSAFIPELDFVMTSKVNEFNIRRRHRAISYSRRQVNEAM